ncbi:hypothetical protein Q7P37_002842 [Cladosporium fusiforme]
MQYLSLLALAGTTVAQGVSKGFNYGNVFTNGAPKEQSDFEAEFSRAQSLPNTSGFSSARLYTMIQGGTTNTPISALQAAIDTQTSLLLGLWASAGDENFQNELDTLGSAIEQYGFALTDLLVGISVGSEDLYRISVQGIENDPNPGVGPDVLVDYIQRTRSVIAGTAASEAPIGHVDTWNDWVNGSNSAVIEAVDWIGFNAFPYFENTENNAVENGNSLFFRALNAVEDVSQDKPVWITEAGWPVGGPTEGQAVASTDNSKTYWDDVGCDIFNQYNVWWYILRDNNADPNPDPSFGIVGRELNDPLFDLSCPSGSNGAQKSASPSSPSATNDNTVGIISNATLGFNNVTIDGVNITEALNITDISNVTTTGAAIDLDLDSIMQNLPGIIASNPRLVNRLPDIIAENSELIERIIQLGIKEGYVWSIPDLSLPPVYVAIIANAIRQSEQRAELDRLASNAGFENGTEGVIDSLGGSEGDGGAEGLIHILEGQVKDAADGR